MSEIIILNLFLSSFMFGLIVTTQLVTYPLFSSISSSGFTNYHFKYVSKISRIAGPAMLLELIIASFLFYNFGNLFSKLIFSWAIKSEKTLTYSVSNSPWVL